MADLRRQLKPYREAFSSFPRLPGDGLRRAEITALVEARMFREFVGLYRRNRRAFARANRARPAAGG